MVMLVGCGGNAPSDAPDPRLTYRATMYRKDETGAGVVLPGVKICVRERSDLPCATTGPNGVAALEVPLADASLSFELAGFEHMIVPYARQSVGGLQLLMSEQPKLETNVTAVGLRFPSAPLVGVNILRDGIVDTSGTVARISVAAEGPIYAGLGGFDALDVSLTATTIAGFAVFGNMAEGEVEITVEHPTYLCAPSAFGGGWPTAEQNRLRAPVVNGADTIVAFECRP